jgi:N-dimethylarginine dimethylaminohydrolase
MSSESDYGNLRKVVLGVAENYLPHIWAWKTDGLLPHDFEIACDLGRGAIPPSIMDEVKEDLENFSWELSKLGVEVVRPPRDCFDSINETYSYISWGNDFYNMRDLHILFGNKLLVAAPSCPSRITETFRLKPFMIEITEQLGLEYISAPTPKLTRNPQVEYVLSGESLVPLENQTGTLLGGDYPEVWHRLLDDEVLFDAANVTRFAGKALYLVSSTGNRRAFEWLKCQIGEKYSIEATDVYRSSHIDSTIIPLNNEKVLVNAARVNNSNLPESLRDKEILYFHEVAPIPVIEREFHVQRKKLASEIKNMGFFSNLEEMSSPWAGLNVLVLKDNLVAVESNQSKLIAFLEGHGFDVLPIRYRHPYTFLGGLHCTTLDILRE